MKVLQIIGLLFILSGASFAQVKIAVVDTGMFEDEKSGIKKLATAVKEIGFLDFIEAFQASDLTIKIEKLEKEIDTLPCDGETLTSKIKKLNELKEQLKTTKDKLIERYRKYEANRIEPIRTQIREKLKEFITKKGYVIVIDKDWIDEGIITDNTAVDDITKEFIKFCNEEFEKEKLQK